MDRDRALIRLASAGCDSCTMRLTLQGPVHNDSCIHAKAERLRKKLKQAYEKEMDGIESRLLAIRSKSGDISNTDAVSEKELQNRLNELRDELATLKPGPGARKRK